MGDNPISRSVLSLTWGVKQSFRAYVESSGGSISAENGATRLAEGGFEFAPSEGNDLTLGVDLSGRGVFSGEVKFDAHGGMLAVFMAEPVIEMTSKGLMLSVADAVSRKWRVEVAQLDIAAMTRSGPDEVSIPTSLTIEGIQWLGDNYPFKTPLDPVHLRLAPAV